MIGKIKNLVLKHIFTEALPLYERRVNLVYVAGFITALTATAGRFFIICSAALDATMLVITFSILILLYISKRYSLYTQCALVTLIMMGNVLFPITFFLVGGVDSGMAAYFVLSVVIIFLLGGYSAISLAGEPKVAGKDFLDAVDYFCNNICLPLGSFLVCLFVGWFWLEPALKELSNDGKLEARWWLKGWIWCVRVVAPIAILIIFLNETGLLTTLDAWLSR